MPELPDLTVVAEAFDAAMAGRPVVLAEAAGPIAVRGTPDDLADLAGQVVRGVRRRGKFLAFDLDRSRIAINPMLTGRLELTDPGRPRHPATVFVLQAGPRTGAPVPRPPVATWTKGATWLPAADRSVEVRLRDRGRMAKVYILPTGIERQAPGFEDATQGPDGDDPGLSLEVWRGRIRRHPGELKNLLRNQSFVAGIGNAYSDEILWAARLQPFRRRSTLAAEEVDDLYQAMREILDRSIGILRERVPPRFEVQVRDFFAVHLRGGQPCPRCGTSITEVAPGGIPTSYCRGCQR